MSNIFLKKKNKYSKNRLDLSNKNKIYNKSNNVVYKYYTKEKLPSQKEWCNSIYSYNKKYIKNTPFYDKMLSELIKSFFNLHYVINKKTEKLVWRNIRIRRKKLSINRILLSKAEILHTNKKAFFNLYIYNAEKRYLVNKLKKINQLSKLTNRRIAIKIKKIKKKAFIFLFFTKRIFKNLNKAKNIKIKKKIKDIYIYPFLLKKFIIKSLIKERLSNYYKKLLWINKSKFENTYIYPIYKIISKYYDKKIEFNIINLKYLHLNSSILSQFIAIKIKNRKIQLKKYLKKFFSHLNISLADNEYKYLLKKKNKFSFKYNITSRKSLINWIFKIISNKFVYGVRLGLSGRLTKRFIAARSISITNYKGTLKNIDSSYKGLPSVILRGHLKSNIQYSKLTSKNRIGSFGVKGWISSL